MSHRVNSTKTKKFEHLTYAKRSQIEILLKAEVPKIKIAKMVGISRATSSIKTRLCNSVPIGHSVPNILQTVDKTNMN